METILDALKAMGKATYREVAARLDIEPVEALNMLREQKEQGLCDFFDGAWSVGTAKEQAKQRAVAPVNNAPRLKGEEPAPVAADMIRRLLRDNSAMTTAALASAVQRNASGMVSVMLAFERQGVVVKNGQGKGVTWSLPETEPVATDTARYAKPEKTTEEIIEAIPAFTARPNDLIVPSSRFISAEIRRTKAKLTNLQRLQDAVRQLRRHKHLIGEQSNE
ncbi:Protein of unknown function DUF1627 [Plasmopara halstedii]|uniref:DUF1627 domain-containing protein n=1 Tax=Plasmopara halstedii TaxID=4781 RepID=A0A0P1AUL4_PLAHL|nr:Protein of unknown function DUF1627 [Plasmopara halstedii]CEG45022.1 Protein of unknown function DUF1627 [Plasmopara halstedii]|eukprot:XP_024581391.1 Protein of unknown function DUF1627 [Plasmopara halstedii]